MAKAKTGAFWLTIVQELTAVDTRYQATLDTGAYVDVGDSQALAVEQVDFIIQAKDTANGIISNSLPGAATGNTQWGGQVSTLNPGTAFLRSDNNALVGSGVVYLDDTNSIVSTGPDLFPDDYGTLDSAKMIINDNIYWVTAFTGSALAANRSYIMTARLKCRVVKLSKQNWMSIAIEQSAADA
jgi:hypothetical protein